MTQLYRTLRVAPSDEGVLGVVIDAPPMNLIGPELVRDLVGLLGALESGPETRVMVLESADPDYFVPHVDLTKVAEYTAEAAKAGGPGDASLGMLWHKLSELPAVTIAKIRGRARGAGSELALACDMRFAARENAILGQIEVGTSILLVPPLVIFFLMKKRYDILFSPYMFLAAFIAFIFITPVIYWNMTHDFISFRYQGGHVFGTFASSFKNFAESLAAQFGAYNPLLFIIAFYGFFKTLRSSDVYLRLAILFGGTIMVFFLFTSFYERTLPHWPSIFYLLFIPVGTYTLIQAKEKWKRNFLYFSIGFGLVLTLFMYVELAGKYFIFPDYKSPFRDIYGFPSILKQADEIMKKNISSAPKAIAVSNWTMGSRTMYYNLPYKNEVFVIDNRQDQFDVWRKKSPRGYDLLFLNTHFNNLDIE